MLFNTFIALLSVSGVLSQDGWGVTYTPERICALKGSSVDMRCAYFHPTYYYTFLWQYYTVEKAFWFIRWHHPQEPEDLSLDREYSGRVEYCGNQISDCTFRIKQLRESDSQTYRFRFLTNHNGKYTGRPGVSLTVTALQVRVNPGSVTEGQSVTLTCSTTCTLTGSPAFTWYRDRSPLSFTTQTHQLTASSEDGGTYSCAVKGSELLPSPAVALTVNYPPKGVSVSVSPSGEIVEGSSVTLTCINQANPPVQRYSWFQENRAVPSETGGPEASYTIKHITQQDAGEYYCEAGNGIGTNRSPPKRLDVQYPPKGTSVSVSPSGEIEEGSSVTLTCRSDANPPVQRYSWFKETGAGAGSGQSLNFSNFSSWSSGQYYCEAKNTHGAQNSTALLLTAQGGRSLTVVAAVGAVAAAAILALVFLGVVCVRRKRSINEEQDLLYSTVQKPLLECEDDVQYASVQFLPSRAAPRSPAVKEDCALYTTVRKHQT
ncbi:hypothetical protein COCON_G00001200 [Conger conger]|uniref:B-cell receptor CD22 n=1 Tax=Conger conger TaxID=82655 RepID=A0A9Q1I848_CONCO|nr:hypothetical protein COCON_G00001200 [Conger conger]